MRLIPFILTVFFSGCLSTGCAAWLGKDEPGIRFKLVPGLPPHVEFEHTADASVKWESLSGRHNESEIEVTGFEYSHDATSVREANVLQMQQAVESQRIATEAITNIAGGLMQMVPGIVQSLQARRDSSDAAGLAELRLKLEAIERVLDRVAPPEPVTP